MRAASVGLPQQVFQLGLRLRPLQDDAVLRLVGRLLDGAVILALIVIPFLLPGYLDLATRVLVLAMSAVKHGLQLSTTNETFAYLPALNRLVQLLRARRTEES